MNTSHKTEEKNKCHADLCWQASQFVTSHAHAFYLRMAGNVYTSTESKAVRTAEAFNLAIIANIRKTKVNQLQHQIIRGKLTLVPDYQK